MLSWKIGTYLNLTGDQVDALEEITFGKHPDSEESLKAMADEVSRVLKAEQREKWVKLLGRPLSFKELSLLHQNPGAHAGAFRIEFTEKNGLEIEGESEENNQE